MDGARISNAAVTLGVNFKEMMTDTGVDILSFGGTKNGLMFGEAIICFNKELNAQMPFMVKHGNQLLYKMRFTEAQFIPYIEEDLWQQNATNANAMVKTLKIELIAAGYTNFCADVQGNIVIVVLPDNILKDLLQKELVHDVFYNNQTYCRFVTSFDTTEADIQDLIKIIKSI